jgi:hypothetical protein
VGDRAMRFAALVGTLLLTVGATAAVASNGPSNAVYGGNGGNVQGALTGTSPSGQLPFTGFDVALLVGAALLLIAVGLGVRRLARSNDAGG